MRVLIVDDEAPARKRLRQLLGRAGDHDCVGEAADGQQALASIDALQPDVVLLDIRMPGMDGIEVARHLAGRAGPAARPAIVFTTAFDQFAVQAFASHALHYLLKPVALADLREALARAEAIGPQRMAALGQTLEQPARQQLYARAGSRLHLIDITEVRYLRADAKYVEVGATSGSYLIEESLASLAREFGERFLRVHRNALVARDAVRGAHESPDGPLRLILDGVPETVAVSRRHRAEVRRLLKRQKAR